MLRSKSCLPGIMLSAASSLGGAGGHSLCPPLSQKATWLLLKGDTDTRMNSPELAAQCLSQDSGADQDTLQATPGDSFYSREWFF